MCCWLCKKRIAIPIVNREQISQIRQITCKPISSYSYIHITYTCKCLLYYCVHISGHKEMIFIPFLATKKCIAFLQSLTSSSACSLARSLARSAHSFIRISCREFKMKMMSILQYITRYLSLSHTLCVSFQLLLATTLLYFYFIQFVCLAGWCVSVCVDTF